MSRNQADKQTRKGLLDLAPEQVVAASESDPEFDAANYVSTLSAYRERAARENARALQLEAENRELRRMLDVGFVLAVRDNPQMLDVNIGPRDEARGQQVVSIIFKPTASDVYVSSDQLQNVARSGDAKHIAAIADDLASAMAPHIAQALATRLTVIAGPQAPPDRPTPDRPTVQAVSNPARANARFSSIFNNSDKG